MPRAFGGDDDKAFSGGPEKYPSRAIYQTERGAPKGDRLDDPAQKYRGAYEVPRDTVNAGFANFPVRGKSNALKQED